jgi:lipocalin
METKEINTEEKKMTTQTHKLYRVSEGEATLVGSAQEAVIPGRFDGNNWGHDWMIFSARSESEALALAGRYDRALNSGAIRAPKFLKSLSHSANALQVR